jgi:phosphotransferase system enzyme I (PtsI)
VSEPVELRGRSAAPGVAVGPVFHLDAEIARRLPTGNADRERVAFESAVEIAIRQIEALTETLGADHRGMLEFQSAMLSDDELIAPAHAAIEAGSAAEAAWLDAIGKEIAGYEATDDEYLRARAADLVDLRDRVLRNLSGVDLAAAPPGAILVGEELTPTRFLETDWSLGGGVALSRGSAASHVAMLARSRGVPMIVGLGAIDADSHNDAMLDGDSGTLVLSPGHSQLAYAEMRRAERAEPAARESRHLLADAKTSDGKQIDVMINVARPEDVESLDVRACDGVGLMRTEFLFGGGELPDEERQFQAYAKVLAWAEGRPVTIRTIDAGGDKPVKGLTVEERNPFLGLRGIRLSLARPEIFRVQLRALARAAVRGNLRIMLPMVTIPAEIAAAARQLDAAIAELQAEKVQAARPPLGIMVEVPAVAIAPREYLVAEFFSIGSNDLTQYVTAAARDSHRVADLCDVTNPAVMKLIADVAGFGALNGIEVSLCGDAAGHPALVPLLLRAGLRSLSVAPSMLGAVKAAIARTRINE